MMPDRKLIDELNAGYQMPADAGPAWRAAVEMGFDMSLIESNMLMTPLERLQQNDSALELIRQLRQAQPVEDARTD